MGLLDSLFNQSTYGGQGGGLLDFLRNNAMNQQFNSGLPSDQAQYGQPAMPMQAMAQMPQPAPQQPPAPIAQPAQPAQSQGFGGFLQGLNENFQNMGNGGSLIGALTGQRPNNQTAQFLVSKGIDPAMAKSIVSDPSLLRSVLPQLISGSQGTVINNRLVDPRSGRVIADYSDTKAPETKEFESPSGGKVAMQWDVASKSWKKVPAVDDSSDGPSVIPPTPPGMDPKIWREAHNKRKTEEAMPASDEKSSKLRAEVRGQATYKRLAVAAPIYNSMLEAAAQNDRAADLNLIYGFASVMDPDSVVRGEEMTMVKAIATLPEQLKSAVTSQLEGAGQLSPEVREALMRQVHSRVKAYQGQFDQDVKQYRSIAQRGRMNEEDVIPSFGTFEQYKPAPKAGPQSAPQIDDLVKKYTK
jgi:hypothetical protein